MGVHAAGGERPDNRRSVVAQLQVDRRPIHRPIQPSGRRPGHMAIASLSRRLMYQRAFDEIADHGVILTIMTIDRVALSRVVAIANGKGGVGKTS